MLPFTLLPQEYTADLHSLVPAVGYLTSAGLLGVILKRPWARQGTGICDAAFLFPKWLHSNLKRLRRPAVALVRVPVLQMGGPRLD
jgi:hypothetical protein